MPVFAAGMIPKKPVRDAIRGGNRFSEKIMPQWIGRQAARFQSITAAIHTPAVSSRRTR
jgi:hypothetical protein